LLVRLCEQIAFAANYEDGQFLRYMLFKITKASVANTQASQFILSEGHASHLASVICRTSEKFPGLSELFRMQIYKSCPPTIPKFVADGGGEDFFTAMGFQKVVSLTPLGHLLDSLPLWSLWSF
jgi:hypothetical protein